MDNIDFISIIIPTYNSERLLGRCLDSVLKAIDANCEVVVVDDGSTDRTVEIARDYENRDERVVVVTQEHSGVSAARKAGLDYSQGDSIMFMDSDDTMAPGAISEMRACDGPGVDIIVGNVCEIRADGSRNLSYSGPRREMTGTEYATSLMTSQKESRLIGKKYRRYLFDVYYWDTNIIYAGLFHRALLLSLACAAKGKVVVAPGIQVCNYIRRPWSLSSMLLLRSEGIARLWQSVSELPVAPEVLTVWGLYMLNTVLIERGIPFSNDFGPAADLRVLSKKYHKSIDSRGRFIANLLKSEKKRLKYAQGLLADGKLTSAAPHLSFVITSHNNASDVERTVKSILATGFRNIDVVIVDDCSNQKTCIALHGLAIRYPRITFKKLSGESGLGAARLEGLESAAGFAVVLVDAGDTVVAEGLLGALREVDSGADVAFFGVRFPLMGGLKNYNYDPTTSTSVRDGAVNVLEEIIGSGQLIRGTHGVMYNSLFLKKHRNIFVKVKDDLEFKQILLVNALMQKPNVGAFPGVGCRRSSEAVSVGLSERSRLFFRLANDMAGFLKDAELDDVGHMRSLSTGVSSVIEHIVSGIIAMPLTGKSSARKFIDKLMKEDYTLEFYRRTGIRQPDVEKLLQKSDSIFRRNRLITYGAMLTRIFRRGMRDSEARRN